MMSFARLVKAETERRVVGVGKGVVGTVPDCVENGRGEADVDVQADGVGDEGLDADVELGDAGAAVSFGG